MNWLPLYCNHLTISTSGYCFSGSHDTMTYCLDERSSVVQSSPRVLRVLDTVLPCIVRPCIIKWATTQVWQTIMMWYCVVQKLYECYFFSGTQRVASVTNRLNHLHCTFIVFFCALSAVKGSVHRKITFLSSFTNILVVLNLYDFVLLNTKEYISRLLVTKQLMLAINVHNMYK